MIPNQTDRHVQTSGVSASGAFSISLRHSAHIVKILRDQIYSDKKMAVLREYSANAWDANREAGNGDKPIKVTLPMVMEPTLSIRDYGLGISHNDVFEIYAQYGESTKRNSDDSVGMLGIGSKSGFAYTDSFTVTTWQNGVQRIYTALLGGGAADAGSMNLLDESPSDEPNGTMIQIPVKPKDIPEFVERAQKLFVHFKPRPEINANLPPEMVPEVVMQHGTISRGGGEWLAVMGCIAYKIDMDQLRGLNAHRGGAGEFLDKLNGYLYFKISEVEIAASREGLEYSDKTKERLIDKFIDLVDEFVKHTLDKIEEGDFSFWEKRCRSQVLNDLHLPIPKIMDTLTDVKIHIGEPKTFTITYGQKQAAVQYIHVDARTRLLIRDEIRRIDGYGLSGYDYVVRPIKDVTPAPTIQEVRIELEKLLGEAKMTGVPVVDISTVAWHQKAKFMVAPPVKTNKKHTVKTFVLDGDDKNYCDPYSASWEIEMITQTDDDVFVLIRKFRVIENPADEDCSVKFYEQFKKDRDIIKSLKHKVPKIYGYKSTEKEPVDLANIKGKQYSTWRVEFFESMRSDPRIKPTFEALDWMELVTRTHAFRRWDSDKIDPKIIATLFKELGRDHEICLLFRKILASRRNLKKVPNEMLTAIRGLRKAIEEAKGEDAPSTQPEILRDKILASYPLFEVASKEGEGFKILLNEKHLDKWIEYVKLVDHAKKGLRHDECTISHGNGRIDHYRMEGETPRGEEGSAELQQLEERDPDGEGDRGLVEDPGPSLSRNNGEGLVERQVCLDRALRNLLQSTGPGGDQAAYPELVGRGQEPEPDSAVL
jgi:hypothetical protein